MSSSDPIALNGSTLKLDQYKWMATSGRSENTVRATLRRPSANAAAERHQIQVARRSAPSAFSPTGFFTDRALANRSVRITNTGTMANGGSTYEPRAIPRSATQEIEEARLASDSSLEWSIFGEDDSVSDGFDDTVTEGFEHGDDSRGVAVDSSGMSSDPFHSNIQLDRTTKANTVNRANHPTETACQNTYESGSSIRRHVGGDSMLGFPYMMDVEIGQPSSNALSLTAQPKSDVEHGDTSTDLATSSSIEHPRSEPLRHQSRYAADSLTDYGFARRESQTTAHSSHSASHQEV